MERSQIAGITSLLPDEADHIRLLDPEGGDIADPSGGEADDYRRSLEAIRAGVRARAREILDETDLEDEGAAA
jgi:protein-tyrosine-phosphatase